MRKERNFFLRLIVCEELEQKKGTEEKRCSLSLSLVLLDNECLNKEKEQHRFELAKAEKRDCLFNLFDYESKCIQSIRRKIG